MNATTTCPPLPRAGSAGPDAGARLRRAAPRAAAAAVLLATATVVFLPVWRSGWPVGHDSVYHYVWATEFTDSLAAGVPYPRWLPDVNAGRGNPTFVFYSPLFYYLVALVRPAAGSIPGAVSIALWLSLLLSGVATYRYLRQGCLARGPALVGAVAMMALPYRLLDLYWRAAWPEFAAFVWPPLAFLALQRLTAAPSLRAASRGGTALALATAGLALTHIVSLVVWGPLLALAAALWGWREGRAAAVARAWGALGLGLGLAAVYLVPAYLERRWVQIEHLGVHRPADHTLLLGRAHANGSPFKDAVRGIALAETALVVVAAAACWAGRAPRPVGTPRRRRLPVPEAALAAVGAFALVTPWSARIWETVPGLPILQFAWRLLIVVTPAAALLAACAAASPAAPGRSPAGRGLALLALGLLGWNLAVSVRDVVLPATLDRAHAAAQADDRGRRDVLEYRPRGAPVGERGTPAFPPQPRAASAAPGAAVEVRRWHPTGRTVVVDGPAGRLRVATFHYPGWRAAIDGRPAPTLAGADGLIEVDVPAGRHVVDLAFGATAPRRAGSVISGLSALALLAWRLAARARPPLREDAEPDRHRFGWRRTRRPGSRSRAGPRPTGRSRPAAP